jgi:hypothetical protein
VVSMLGLRLLFSIGRVDCCHRRRSQGRSRRYGRTSVDSVPSGAAMVTGHRGKRNQRPIVSIYR